MAEPKTQQDFPDSQFIIDGYFQLSDVIETNSIMAFLSSLEKTYLSFIKFAIKHCMLNL